jgi:hypothetical protein
MEAVMRGVAVSGYREKAFGIILNGWKPEDAARVRDAVMKYSDDRHKELLAGPDEIFIYIRFGRNFHLHQVWKLSKNAGAILN